MKFIMLLSKNSSVPVYINADRIHGISPLEGGGSHVFVGGFTENDYLSVKEDVEELLAQIDAELVP